MKKYNRLIKLICLISILDTLVLVNLIFYKILIDLDKLELNIILPVKKGGSLAKNQTTDKREILKMIFSGDIMLDRHVKEKIEQKGGGYLLEKLANQENNFLEDKDLVSANLEGAVTNNGQHYTPVMDYDFAFLPEAVALLKDYNFNFFNLANNHLFDQGERGAIETEKNLQNLGFNFSGCPDGTIGDCSSKVIEIKGKSLGMIGLSMVYKDFELTKAEKIINDLIDRCDIIIINIHWGQEYQHRFSQKQQQIAHRLIDSGADIIIGHHPHVVQGLEIYKNKLIFYSLGNFIFDQYFSQETQQGLAVEVDLEKDQKIFYLFPLQSKLSQIELITGQEREKFLENFASWSSVDDNDKKEIIEGVMYLRR